MLPGLYKIIKIFILPANHSLRGLLLTLFCKYEVGEHINVFGYHRSRHTRKEGDTYVGLKNVEGPGDIRVSAVLGHALVEVALDGGLEIAALHISRDANSQFSHEDYQQ